MLAVELQARAAEAQLPDTSNSSEPRAHFKTRTILRRRTMTKKTLARIWGSKHAPSTTKVMRSLTTGPTVPRTSSSA